MSFTPSSGAKSQSQGWPQKHPRLASKPSFMTVHLLKPAVPVIQIQIERKQPAKAMRGLSKATHWSIASFMQVSLHSRIFPKLRQVMAGYRLLRMTLKSLSPLTSFSSWASTQVSWVQATHPCLQCFLACWWGDICAVPDQSVLHVVVKASSLEHGQRCRRHKEGQGRWVSHLPVSPHADKKGLPRFSSEGRYVLIFGSMLASRTHL